MSSLGSWWEPTHLTCKSYQSNHRSQVNSSCARSCTTLHNGGERRKQAFKLSSQHIVSNVWDTTFASIYSHLRQQLQQQSISASFLHHQPLGESIAGRTGTAHPPAGEQLPWEPLVCQVWHSAPGELETEAHWLYLTYIIQVDMSVREGQGEDRHGSGA